MHIKKFIYIIRLNFTYQWNIFNVQFNYYLYCILVIELHLKILILYKALILLLYYFTTLHCCLLQCSTNIYLYIYIFTFFIMFKILNVLKFCNSLCNRFVNIKICKNSNVSIFTSSK